MVCVFIININHRPKGVSGRDPPLRPPTEVSPSKFDSLNHFSLDLDHNEFENTFYFKRSRASKFFYSYTHNNVMLVIFMLEFYYFYQKTVT